jgi:hypothetical protein
LLIAADNEGRPVFHKAANFYRKEVFQGILNLAKENVTEEEVYKLLLPADNERRAVFHVAETFCGEQVFQGILNWAKGNLTTQEES